MHNSLAWRERTPSHGSTSPATGATPCASSATSAIRLHPLERQRRLSVPVFDGLRTAGRVAQAKSNVAKVRQTASPSRPRSGSSQEGIARLTVARASSRPRAEREAGTEGPRHDPGQLQPRRGHDARRARRQAALSRAESTRLEALHEHADARATLRYVMGVTRSMHHNRPTQQ